MKTQQLESGLVLPIDRSKEQPKCIYNFDCYYYSDVIKFLKLLENNGNLISVVRYNGAGLGCSHGYCITYLSTDVIDMEVLC